MAKNNLATILEQVNLSPGQLASTCRVHMRTVRALVARKRTAAPWTQERLVRTLNWLSKKNFTREEVFPPKPKVRRHRKVAKSAAAPAPAAE